MGRTAVWLLGCGIACTIVGTAALAQRAGVSAPSAPRRAAAVPGPVAQARAWIARERSRAWRLLDTMTAGGTASFSAAAANWYPEAETFALRTARPRSSDAGHPNRLVLFEPIERQGVNAPAFPIYEATFFNQAAFAHIRAHQLFRAGRAVELRNQKRREIPEFPQGAVVLKTFWRPVPLTSAPDRRAWVGVWKWRPAHTPDSATLIGEGDWPSLTGRKPECVVQASPANGCLIASDRFVTAQAADLKGMACAAGSKCPAKVERDQVMLLIGLHIAAKELPDWFWATFWWKGVDRTTGTSWTCDNAQRPVSLSTGAWSNYSLDVGPSFQLAKPPVGAETSTCGTPGKIGNIDDEFYATYNPFVEGVKDLGRKSSCLDCHARATSSDTLSRRGEIPPVSDVNADYPDLRRFENHIRTDYLWTVSRYIGPTKDPTY